MPNISLLTGDTLGVRCGLAATGTHHVSRMGGGNASGTSLWLLVFDSLTEPTTGTQALGQCLVDYGTSTAYTEGGKPLHPEFILFSTGVYWAWSSTPGTYTPIASGTGLFSELWGV